MSKSFNTQPPEGGWAMYINDDVQYMRVSTHSRPKAAGPAYLLFNRASTGFQHTAARRRLAMHLPHCLMSSLFQHTAARRRLASGGYESADFGIVSTHSRPKAAGIVLGRHALFRQGFNTQPPEGGWFGGYAKAKNFL